ncbi:cytochrome P450 [Dendrothele bispora CBS 962.96]|uniref:Cytochrome P450 n=1 Tax=Dendrothele bispora (strain CBS 962.96) TaxID=1314807 RepID=A0A4S8LW11_DENBC|nr:cytochrome P450 [Dendrothele bispora CBS 962.96]
MDVDVGRVSLALFSIFFVSRIFKFFSSLKRVNSLPGQRPPFQPFGLPGALLPTTWWNLGADMHWIKRKTLYQHSETVSIVPWFIGPSSIWCSNLDVARQVASGGHKSCWIKPEEASQALLLWGMNLAASEGETWRRHRRVMGPAFNSKLYKLVWESSVRTYRDMIDTEGWDGKKEVKVESIQDLTFKFALLLIGKCGFGFNFTWADPPKSSSTTKMPVQEAIRTVADTYMLFVFAPRWVKWLPFEKFRHARQAYSELEGFMREQVAQRRAAYNSSQDSSSSNNDNNGTATQGSDAFSLLVSANEDSESKYKLDDEELIGNVFVMLFAGHETTAHTLAATLGFLAVYDEFQEEAAKEIIDVVGMERDPIFEDYPKFVKTASCFFEALRMFPAGHVMVRKATEDTVLNVPPPRNQDQQDQQDTSESKLIPMPIPKGTDVIIDMIGVQYNPRYFPDPHTYKPSRWHGLGNMDSEGFTAFSIGPRACIGRRFATTEAICFLACLLKDYKVEPDLKMKPDGTKETKSEWKSRVLDAKIVLTLGVKDVPVKFVKRG